MLTLLRPSSKSLFLNQNFQKCFVINYRNKTYVQGQHAEENLKKREYFYYIDHQGMLFLDDSRMKNFTSCFKDKIFLKFFFKRLKISEGHRYNEFPYLSPCGPEINYVRCDDLPIVFTHIVQRDNSEFLSYAHAGDDFCVPFEPSKLCMNIATGRVYHPGPAKAGGVGLIHTKLAISISSNFIFKKGQDFPPTHIEWSNKVLELSDEVNAALLKLEKVRKFSLGIN